MNAETISILSRSIAEHFELEYDNVLGFLVENLQNKRPCDSFTSHANPCKFHAIMGSKWCKRHQDTSLRIVLCSEADCESKSQKGKTLCSVHDPEFVKTASKSHNDDRVPCKSLSAQHKKCARFALDGSEWCKLHQNPDIQRLPCPTEGCTLSVKRDENKCKKCSKTVVAPKKRGRKPKNNTSSGSDSSSDEDKPTPKKRTARIKPIVPKKRAPVKTSKSLPKSPEICRSSDDDSSEDEQYNQLPSEEEMKRQYTENMDSEEYLDSSDDE